MKRSNRGAILHQTAMEGLYEEGILELRPGEQIDREMSRGKAFQTMERESIP